MLRHSQAGALLTCREHAAAAAELARSELPVVVIDEVDLEDRTTNISTGPSQPRPSPISSTPPARRGSRKPSSRRTGTFSISSPCTAKHCKLAEHDGYADELVRLRRRGGGYLLRSPQRRHAVPRRPRADGLHRPCRDHSNAQVTIYHSVPTVFRQFDRSLPEGSGSPSVRRVVLGGEEVVRSDFEAFRRRSEADSVFVNLAGQAESSINSLGVHTLGDGERLGPASPGATPSTTRSSSSSGRTGNGRSFRRGRRLGADTSRSATGRSPSGRPTSS